MKLVPENFKLIPTTYNGNDFMKIQYEDRSRNETQRIISYHRRKKLWFAFDIHSRRLLNY